MIYFSSSIIVLSSIRILVAVKEKLEIISGADLIPFRIFVREKLLRHRRW